MTDGNTDAINRHLAEREEHDAWQEVRDAIEALADADERIDELEAKLAEVEAERDAWETAQCQSVEMNEEISHWYVEAEARAEAAEQRVATLEAMLPRAYRAGLEEAYQEHPFEAIIPTSAELAAQLKETT